MFNRITKSIQSRLQYWLGIPVLFTEVDRAHKRITRLENKTRQGRRAPRGMPLPKKVMGPRRYDQVNRDRARPRKAAHSV